MLRPRSGAGQWVVGETYALTPAVPVTEFTDGYGNLCQRLIAPQGTFEIKTTAQVETADRIDVAPGARYVPVEELPDDVLRFLLPSRYVQSDRLGDKAQEIVGQAAPGYDQAEAIRAWIQTNLVYQYGTSDASTSALETLDQGAGVCRDFAHVGLALCRSLTLPARMVVGYLYQLDPMDLHAWFEVYVGQRWYTFDPTQAEARGGRVVLGYGRDAADVALATQFGPATLSTMQVAVTEVSAF
jgi:transglutaminase-like putative cysteine protease